MRKSPPSWIWPLAVSGAMAVLVAGACVVFARQVDRFTDKPPGNRVDEAFRETGRRIAVLERRWQEALEDEAKKMLEAGGRDEESRVAGVVQRSWLNPSFSDSNRAHRRFDGSEVGIRPVLERFSRGEPAEWIFPEKETVATGGDWIEQAGRPLGWRQGNGRVAVVLLLDPAAAVRVVERELAGHAAAPLPAGEPGALCWRGPDGRSWRTSGVIPDGARPDEIVRHPSRFGDWTLLRFYPVRIVESYHGPTLAGGFSIAALLVAGGVALAASQRKAARLAEERVSFVNRVSHELRTPLTNLLLNTDLALDGLSERDGKLRRRLGLIREETGRLSRIVDNVLVFARIERGRQEIAGRSCDLAALVDEVRENFSPLFERKSIRCRYDPVDGKTIPLDGDALSRILANLLSNVEKYAGESAEARVKATAEDGRLVVEVSDNGPGIPDGARERVFLPFERAGSRVNEGASGTGLGLAISRELARGMGGRLELVPTGCGATFRLEVPLERSSA